MKQDATLELNLNDSNSAHMASSSTIFFDVQAFSLKVKTLCDKICLPIHPPVILGPMDELAVLLDPPSSCIKPIFSLMRRSMN